MNKSWNKLWLIAVIFLFIIKGTYSVSNAPDYYQIKIWQGGPTSITTTIVDWTTVCNTDPANDAHDGSGGYSCSYNIKTGSVPRFCSVEGDYYFQWRFYDEDGGSYQYSYSPGNCFGSACTPNGAFMYNVNYDADANDCQCKVGAGRFNLGGEISGCCGDDGSEYKITCIGDVGACSGDNVACCNAASDCVYNNVCYSNGASRSGFVCDNGYWRRGSCGVVIDGATYSITTASGSNVAKIDDDGDIVFFCPTMATSTSPPSGLTNSFIVNVGGTDRFAMSTTNCYIAGSIYQLATVPAADGADFLITNTGGTPLVSFNSNLNVYAKGYAAYPGGQAGCPTGYHCGSSLKCVPN